MKNYVLFDLDGTIANVDHRVDWAKSGQWDEFHSRCVEDKLYHEIRTIAWALANYGCQLIILTGRNEKYRGETEAWLHRFKIPFEHLLMRPNNDFSKDGELKVRLIEEFFGEQGVNKQEVLDRILFALDDRDQSVIALRNYGITVLQTREGAY